MTANRRPERKPRTARPAAWALAACLLLGASGARAERIIFKVSNVNAVSLEEMVRDLRQARAVFVGERHDRRVDHAAQLEVVRALHESGARVAVALEMFRADAQAQLDAFSRGEMSLRDFFAVYADNWETAYWPLYRDIFAYAQAQGIPLVGLNVPRPVVRQVARQGFASLAAEQKGELPPITCDVDAKYQDVLAKVLGFKEDKGTVFSRFCEAQVVWDAAMAHHLLAYAEANPERTVVVLAGTFHAWKHGIPEQLERRSDLPYRVVLPSSDDSFLRYDIVLQDADYVWWHEP